MIDLHIHSTYSDGSDSVEAIFKKAKHISLTAISITDHDTMEHFNECDVVSKKYSIEWIPGVEVSTIYDGREIHILGYWVDSNNLKLKIELKELLESRTLRNIEMTKKLTELGYPITMEELKERWKAPNLGRPHMAKTLIEKGYFKEIRDVFDALLKQGKPAYVGKKKEISPFEAIEWIKNAGGVSSLAHPMDYYKEDRKTLQNFILSLKEAGLSGVETYYSTYNLSQVDFLKRVSTQLELAPTGGSDYHGIYKPKINIGRGLGSLFVPDSSLEKLKSKRFMF